jgi:hypothetical protein
MMKLFEAKWRQFINEKVATSKTAYFFDFDETLVFDKNPTHLYFLDNEQTTNDPIAMQLRNSKEDAKPIIDAEGGDIFDPSTNEPAFGWLYQVIDDQHTLDKMTKQFDNDQNRHRFFFDYSRSRIVNEPTINVRVMNIFLNKLRDSQNNTVCILTARGSDVQDDLMNLFDDLLRQKKRDTSVLSDLHIFTLGSGEYGTKSKGEFMAQYYRKNTEVQNVAFYEDSETNLAGAKAAFENPEFRMMLEKRGGNAVIYKVVHGDPQVYLTV